MLDGNAAREPGRESPSPTSAGQPDKEPVPQPEPAEGPGGAVAPGGQLSAADEDLRKAQIGRVLFLRSCKSVSDSLPEWVGFAQIDLQAGRYHVELVVNRIPNPEEIGRLRHTFHKALDAPVTLSWKTPDGLHGSNAPVTNPAVPRQAPAPDTSRATSLSEDIEQSLPRGIELRKLSLYKIPFGRTFSTFAVLKVNIREVPESAINGWRNALEAKHGVFIVLQNHRVSAGLNRQLSRLADADGILRDETEVARLQERIHGPVPRYDGVAAHPVIPGLRDLTSRRLITIDPPGALDNDDALGAERLPNGNTLVTVSFADVAWRVKPGSAMDEYARKAVFSLYGRHNVVPLLGRDLSLNELSLRPGQERLAYTVELEVDPRGQIVRTDFFRAKMKSHAQYSYQQIQGILGGAPSDISDVVKELKQATWLLRKQRLQRASMIKIEGEGESHGIVEECMLAAKHDIAKRLHAAGLPVIYKVHATPSREQRRIFLHQVKALGIPARSRDFTDPVRFCALLGCLRDTGANSLVYRILDSYLGKARYDTRNFGHEGLKLDAYIEIKGLRNYAGIVNQRAAEQLLSGSADGVQAASVRRHCNEINRKNRAYSENAFKLLTLERIREGLEQRDRAHSAEVSHTGSEQILVAVPGFERWGILAAAPGSEYAKGEKMELALDGYDLRRGRFVFRAQAALH